MTDPYHPHSLLNSKLTLSSSIRDSLLEFPVPGVNQPNLYQRHRTPKGRFPGGKEKKMPSSTLAVHLRHHYYLGRHVPSSSPSTLKTQSLRFYPIHPNNSPLTLCHCTSNSPTTQGTNDPDLHPVLQLATNAELYELERILFGPSYFSPLLKSMTMNKLEFDHYMIEYDLEERDEFIRALESQFLYLAADARSTLRGWRPSYRNVLLSVRKELNVHCSSKLPTEDLEAEIFVHLLEASSSQSMDQASAAALRVGSTELQSTLLKLARRFLGKAFLETAKYQMEKDILRKGGQLAAVNLERQVALFAARKGVARVASGYVGLRSLMTFVGPMLWGTFLADVVIQMLGTDYARILRAILAVAQIRITRTHKLLPSGDQESSV
ncbi:hypothetical protein V2J09_010989 [Rumex salicifolius]